MSWLVTGDADDGAELARRAEAKLAARRAAGVLDENEIARVSAARVALLEADGVLSEAFRQACVHWRIDAPVPLSSHRSVVGPLLVAAKRLVARLLRFHVEVPLARQAEFNRNLLVVLHELARRPSSGSDRSRDS